MAPKLIIINHSKVDRQMANLLNSGYLISSSKYTLVFKTY